MRQVKTVKGYLHPNAIESQNSEFWDVIKKRKMFPMDNSMREVIYQAIKEALKNGVCRAKTGR